MNIQQINTLIQAGKNREAYAALSELLRQEPQNAQALKIRDQLEKSISQNNQIIITQRLNTIKEQLKTGAYQATISELLKLQKQVPNNSQITELLEAAYSKMKSTNTQTQTTQTNDLSSNIKKLQKAGKHQEALALASNAYKEQSSSFTQKLLIDTKKQYVDFKLAKNKDQLFKIPTTKALEFLKTLSNVSPNHKPLQKLILEFTNKIKRQESIKQSHYYKDQNRQIKVLYFQGKYIKCIELSKQILLTKPKTKIAKKFLAKSQKAIEIQNHKNAVTKLKSYNIQLKQLSPEQKQAQYS